MNGNNPYPPPDNSARHAHSRDKYDAERHEVDAPRHLRPGFAVFPDMGLVRELEIESEDGTTVQIWTEAESAKVTVELSDAEYVSAHLTLPQARQVVEALTAGIARCEREGK